MIWGYHYFWKPPYVCSWGRQLMKIIICCHYINLKKLKDSKQRFIPFQLQLCTGRGSCCYPVTLMFFCCCMLTWNSKPQLPYTLSFKYMTKYLYIYIYIIYIHLQLHFSVPPSRKKHHLESSSSTRFFCEKTSHPNLPEEDTQDAH